MGPAAGLPGDRQGEAAEASALRAELERWVEATNEKDIRRQMNFYMPRLLAYYLTRNTPREFVRTEKLRVFAKAANVNVRAEEPEIVFIERSGAAVMRFRKRYGQRKSLCGSRASAEETGHTALPGDGCRFVVARTASHRPFR